MHSEGHIVAHLHITEIEHEHPQAGVRVSASDNEEVNQEATCSINPGGLLELPRTNQCKKHMPRTPTSTSGLLEPYDSSESSVGSNIIVQSAACESPRPGNGTHKGAAGDHNLDARTDYDIELERKPGENKMNGREEEGGIKLRNHVNGSVGPSKRSSDYIDAGDIVFHAADRHRTKWEEAAIFVKEGEDNEKFNHHPQGRWSKLAFKILHHPAYYITHLIVTILLMLLALAENYPTPRNGHQISDEARLYVILVDTVLEFLFLAFIAVYLVLKIIWFGPRQFITSKTTVLNTLILIAMLLEAITVLARQEYHIHVTRALRPIFFIDNLLMDGVRREIRDILKSLKPILDVLMLLLFFMFIFALLGYYLLAEVDPSYFDSFKKSFISLFILKTTANNPDIMLESYYEHPISVIYFTLYLIVTLYFLNNVLLAVVYSSFSDAEMMKFKQLYLHKRKALYLAYNTLTSPGGIGFHDFLLFMQHYRPRLTEFEAMCMFKSLHKDSGHDVQSHPQGVTREEFYSLYEVQGMRWKQTQNNANIPWYEEITCQLPIKACHQLVKSKIFKAIVNLIVLVNVLAFAVYALTVDDFPPEDRFKQLRLVYPLSMAFCITYCVEITLKIIGLGPHNYYRKPWNVIDTLIVLVSLICLLLEVDSKLAFLALVRPIKLLRLLRLKRRYRDIMSTIVYLAPKMLIVAVFLGIVYYFFAIIGVEFLSGKVFKGCCNESWFSVGSYYVGNIAENATDSIDPAASDVFYILHFDDILNSYVTLFALMVVNNWFIIMEGFASQVEQDWLARIYFLSFNIMSMVIFEVVISFIVEAFVFKMLARQRSRMCPTHNKPYCQCKCAKSCDHKKKVTITLLQADVDEIKQEYDSRHTNSAYTIICNFAALNHSKLWRENLSNVVSKTYVGKRHKTKDDIQLQMYRPLLQEWIKEAEDKKADHDNHETENSERESQPLRALLLKYINSLYDYITE